MIDLPELLTLLSQKGVNIISWAHRHNNEDTDSYIDEHSIFVYNKSRLLTFLVTLNNPNLVKLLEAQFNIELKLTGKSYKVLPE